jgi:divalent metal cation (Fe/Co/Zn/Cd) transporter
VTARRAQIRRALALSIASVAWSGVIGATAVVAALSSGALSLLGFGVTALIDAAASAVLIWRFRTEARNPLRAAQVERRAERAIGGALLALAIYLLVSSARALLSGQHPAAERVGIALLGASLIVQPLLGVLQANQLQEL